ncbi:EF-hand calcium-binding domain-containing protein 4B [Lampris incognitus]|uniref:EF-hand calcium-binding domain-containing protein 4B n=1 Tax=Lampris incognitus TaxID=2546036 RepID=UPI0024B59B6E|nr:EF-hand calcium-binding domain-containing protein 4B [Lampris incognitus]
MAAFAFTHATSDVTGTATAAGPLKSRQEREEETCIRESDWSQGEDGNGGHETILDKTHEIFQICDIEEKGFVTRRDMQRLKRELPLSADELENVFDTLDADGNGYLTLDEFSSGFSEFLSGRKISVEEGTGETSPRGSPPEALYQSQWDEKLTAGEDEEEQHFCMLLESLGASNVLEDPGEVRSLWARLRHDEPQLLSNFEEFLARVTSQIKEANQEKRDMESALKRKVATHDDEIQYLYEEMEQQIKNEKDRILLQDYERFLSHSQDLDLQLSGKEKELDQLLHKQRRLESQCQELHSERHVTKVENVKLKQTNDELALELEQTSQQLMLAEEQLSLLQEQSSRLHEEKELELYRATEGLQRERASLLKQLDMLREMNKHLRDERDICYQKPANSKNAPAWNQRPLLNTVKHTDRAVFKSVDEELTPNCNTKSLLNRSHRLPSLEEETIGNHPPPDRKHLPRIISIEEDHLPQLLQGDSQAQSPVQEWSEAEEATEEEEHMDLAMSNIFPPMSSVQPQQHGDGRRGGDIPPSPRGQPVGKETSLNEESTGQPPDRLFKIVLVGNSSVGKTSLLRRFCDDCFYPCTSATVGIDYSVKTITVDNSQVALQMWDTAGQERYRSITKQFFRKADGVVVMYDITAERSFTAVRQWLMNVKEGTGEDIPIMLLGNKTDRQNEREVQIGVGVKLAQDCQLIFFECSACSGHNVMESMIHLARILKEQEDREKEKTVQLHSPSEKKRSCC